MKLCYSATSPFARKVLAVAIEKGLRDQIEFTQPDTSDVFKGINPKNPLGKIPSLELDTGELLFDSIVIAEYLDAKDGNPTLFPTEPLERAKVMTLHAMANGMTDAAFSRRWDATALPEGERSPTWSERLRLAVENCLNVLEKEVSDFGGKTNIGTIAVACGLGYLDLRFSHEDWRKGRPNLTAWFEEFSKKPSIAETAPPAS
ncbi:glutathione S-transferase N-terminal domain-containing protein [Sneathiella limimaris]|uniref:glutathione S-transferase N-terminal domain-containing protein n=1 Tax=Sneathiella limimaris TaxID=1964213 RepID=UPI00146B8016|nr:glutathione S-transferase N-terminal domain-containing protein [Sneathiella limimaris]